jgi:GIY-YIG catalytic domain
MSQSVSVFLKGLPTPDKGIFIYGLFCPDTKDLKYIGLSTNGFRRIKEHYKTFKKTKTAKERWVNRLRKDNKIFDVYYFEYFDADGIHLDEAEQFYIAYFKSLGCELLNHTAGGRGVIWTDLNKKEEWKNNIKLGMSKPESVEKRRAIATKIQSDPQHKQRMSIWSKQMWQTTPEKMCSSNWRFLQNPESRKKRLESQNKHSLHITDSSGNKFNNLKEFTKFHNTNRNCVFSYMKRHPEYVNNKDVFINLFYFNTEKKLRVDKYLKMRVV